MPPGDAQRLSPCPAGHDRGPLRRLLRPAPTRATCMSAARRSSASGWTGCGGWSSPRQPAQRRAAPHRLNRRMAAARALVRDPRITITDIEAHLGAPVTPPRTAVDKADGRSIPGGRFFGVWAGWGGATNWRVIPPSLAALGLDPGARRGRWVFWARPGTAHFSARKSHARAGTSLRVTPPCLPTRGRISLGADDEPPGPGLFFLNLPMGR